MNTQHTPGPWLYDISRTGTEALITEEDGTTVAEIRTTHKTTAHSTLEANVTLMAAAPDMLEALQKIHAWWTSMPSFYEGEDEMPADVFDAMRHAIARATHGTNDDGE